jgi:hypothetical protein
LHAARDYFAAHPSRPPSVEVNVHMPLPSFAIRLFTLTVAALGAALIPAACGSEEDDDNATNAASTGTVDCEAQGGVIVDGVCEAKCVASSCLEGLDGGVSANICVDNLCALTCSAHADCFNYNGGAGFPTQGQGYFMHTQDCAAEQEDDTAAAVQVCQSNGKARGYGYACPFGNECSDVYRVYACPNGAPCDGPAAPSCAIIDGNADGVNDNVCVADLDACRGVADCQKGRCALEKSPCSLTPQCAPEACQPLTCNTFGEGDAEAYCTRTDCKEDADCPGGFYCGAQRVNLNICGKEGDKGPSAFPLCGDDPEAPCVAEADFQANGNNYFEGSVCLMRTMCLKREPCTSCATDIDCSDPDMRCARTPADQAQVCATLCNPANPGDCPLDEQCDTNALVTPIAGVGACVPRFGKCKGTGAFCDPCLDDRDCGATGVCLTASGTERACLSSYPPTDTCTTNADCPASVTGVKGTCLDEDWGVAPGSDFYHKCYLPIDNPQVTGKTSCYLP